MRTKKQESTALSDRTTINVDSEIFQKIMDWLDSLPTPSEAAGIQRILKAKVPWQID